MSEDESRSGPRYGRYYRDIQYLEELSSFGRLGNMGWTTRLLPRSHLQ